MKIGVIGAGAWGRNLVRNFHELGVLAAVADPSEETRKKLSSEYPGITLFSSATELIQSSVDAVAIATPVQTHAELGKQALLAGKHSFIEKPVTLRSQEAEELKKLAEEKGLVLMVGHLLLYQPAIQWIKTFLDSEKIGTVKAFHQSRCSLGRARKVENVLWSFGVHDIAVLLYLSDSKIASTQAIGQNILQPNIADDTYVHLQFENGVHAHLHNSWLWPERARHLTIIGTEGMLVYDEMNQKVFLHRKWIDRDLQNQDHGHELVFDGHGEPLKLELAHFLECIQENKKPVSDGTSGAQVIRVLEMASKALEAR